MRRSVCIDGEDIRYFDNRMSGPTIVFCHGNSSSSRAFEKLAAILGDRARVIAFDFYGHGESSLPLGAGCSIKGYARLLQKFIAKMGLTSYVLIGHSLGGHVSMEALPALASGLKAFIGISAPPISQQTIGNMFKQDPTGGLLFKDTLDDHEAETLAAYFVDRDRLSTYDYNEVVGDIKATRGGVRGAIAASVMAGDYSDELEIIRKIDVPQFFIQGRNDKFINIDCYKTVAQAGNWRGQVFFADRCFHCPHIENAHLVSRIIQICLGRIAGKIGSAEAFI